MGGELKEGGYQYTCTKLRWWQTVTHPGNMFLGADHRIMPSAETTHCGLIPEGHATVARAEHYRDKVHKPVAVNAALGKLETA
jgi:hypothetical protein